MRTLDPSMLRLFERATDERNSRGESSSVSVDYRRPGSRFDATIRVCLDGKQRNVT